MATQVDSRGKLCPLPLIMLRKSMMQNPNETEFEVLTDNAISCSNLIDFIRDQGYTYETKETMDYTIISFTVEPSRPEIFAPRTDPRREPVAKEPKKKCILKISSDQMGQGDEKLGKMLLSAFLNTLPELDEKPTHIICYNSGVKLACRDTSTAQALLRLRDQEGIAIILCGTCVEYYDLIDRLEVGQVSNLYSISKLLMGAEKILSL